MSCLECSKFQTFEFSNIQTFKVSSNVLPSFKNAFELQFQVLKVWSWVFSFFLTPSHVLGSGETTAGVTGIELPQIACTVGYMKATPVRNRNWNYCCRGLCGPLWKYMQSAPRDAKEFPNLSRNLPKPSQTPFQTFPKSIKKNAREKIMVFGSVFFHDFLGFLLPKSPMIFLCVLAAWVRLVRVLPGVNNIAETDLPLQFIFSL